MHKKILGVDPGLGMTGWGIIKTTTTGKIQHIAHSCIKGNVSQPLQKKLAHLFNSIALLLTTHQPDVMVIEETFVGVNAASGIRLGCAYGVISCAGGLANIPVIHIPPRLVKKTITNNGAASKAEVANVVQEKLNLPSFQESFDMSDALAVALAYILGLKTTVKD